MIGIPTHDPNAALRQAAACQQAGDFAGAAAIYGALLKRFPGHPQLLALAGAAALQRGDFKESASLLEKSLKVAPNQPDTLSNRGVALQALRRYGDAQSCFDRAVALAPDFVEALFNRANLARLRGRTDDALADYTNVLARMPDHVGAHLNRGGLLLDQDRAEAALRDFDAACALAPTHADAQYDRGNALSALGRDEAALDAYGRAIALDPGHVKAHSNRGNTLVELGRHGEAGVAYDRALAIDPHFAEALWNKGNLCLQTGDWQEGWALYEYRWQASHLKTAPHRFETPPWLGEEPLAGKTILIHAEQGYGDAVQFCRYVPLVAALGAKVIVEARAALLPLLASLTGVERLVEAGDALPPFDCHCPMLSLPLALGATMAAIPPAPYLAVDPTRQAKWRDILGMKTAPRIGLTWAGSDAVGTFWRTMPTEVLAPLLDLPFEFHAVQYGCEVPPGPQVHLHSAALNDFADIAALIAEMDLTISIDTAAAHVAGSLGKTVWVALPFASDWRWLLHRADSPWYASARLFRQASPGDWDGVIADIVRELSLPNC